MEVIKDSRFTRRQVNSLLVLGLITIVLFVGIFFLPWVIGGSGEVGGPSESPTTVPPNHNPHRNARSANSPYLEWETNFGGSGDDTVVGAFMFFNEIIIFGNTTSTDYDFAAATTNSSFFMTKISPTGTLISHRVQAGELVKVLPITDITNAADGFLLAVNTHHESYVIKTCKLGIESHRTALRADNSANEKIVYIYIDDFASTRNPPFRSNVFHAVMQHTAATDGTNSLRVHLLDANLNDNRTHFFRRTGESLEFVAAFAVENSFKLFAGLRGHQNSLSFIYFTWPNPHNSDTNHLQGIRAPISGLSSIISIMPSHADGSFILLAKTTGNVATLFRLYNFGSSDTVTRREVSSQSASNVAMFGGLNHFYVFENQANNVGNFRRYNKTNFDTIMPHLDNFISYRNVDAHSARSDRTLFVGRTQNTISVADVRTAGLHNERSFNSTTATIQVVIPVDNSRAILVGTSGGIGENIGGHFGRTDIWVTLMRIGN